MVAEELEDGFDEITEELIDFITEKRTSLKNRVVSAVRNGDTSFRYADECKASMQSIRAKVSLLLTADISCIENHMPRSS